MAKINVKVIGLKELEKKLKDAPKVLQNEVSGVLRDGAGLWVRNAQRDAPANNADLRRSIHFSEVDPLQYDIAAQQAYAPFVEFGTRSKVQVPAGLEEFASQYKGRNPPSSLSAKEAIFKWCKQKGIDEGAWYAIYIKLMTEGVTPRPFFFKQQGVVWPKVIADVKQILSDMEK